MKYSKEDIEKFKKIIADNEAKIEMYSNETKLEIELTESVLDLEVENGCLSITLWDKEIRSHCLSADNLNKGQVQELKAYLTKIEGELNDD